MSQQGNDRYTLSLDDVARDVTESVMTASVDGHNSLVVAVEEPVQDETGDWYITVEALLAESGEEFRLSLQCPSLPETDIDDSPLSSERRSQLQRGWATSIINRLVIGYVILTGRHGAAFDEDNALEHVVTYERKAGNDGWRKLTTGDETDA